MQRNLFWIALAVILLVTLAAYVFAVKPVRAEANDLDEQFKQFEADFARWAKKPDESVFSDTTIESIGGYKEDLNAELQAVEKELASKQLDVKRAGFEPEPPVNSVEFREWLKAKYAERDAAAIKVLGEEFILAKTPAERGDYPVETSSIDPEDRDIALKRFYITREVYSALAKCTMIEKGKGRDPEDETREVDVSSERRLDGLRRLVFMTAKDMAGTRGGGPRFGGGGSGGLPDAPEVVRGKAYKEHLFELEVVCHFALVQQVIRNLDGIDDFMVVIKRADVVHTKAPKRVGAGVVGKDIFANTREREAPVALVIECAVLELEF